MPRIALLSVYSRLTTRLTTEVDHSHVNHLYELLKERMPHENISHKKLPTLEDHIKYINSKPHKAWYTIQALESYYPFVGMVYLGQDNNIGIGILKKYRREGYAQVAIKALMRAHKEKEYFANINPNNLKSKELFEKLGFKWDNTLYNYTVNDIKIPVQDIYKKSLFTRRHSGLANRIKLRPLLFDGS